ncbi:MAG: TIM barrel protein [Blastocatellia bacterium]
MERRDFIRTAAGITLGAVAADSAAIESSAAPVKPKGKYHIRYAPHLTILSDQKRPDYLTIPQRLELVAEHGFDAVEYNSLYQHPFSEIEEIRKKMDSLGIEMGIFVCNPDGWTDAGVVNPKHHEKFLQQVRRAIEIHKIIGNRSVTTLTGMAVPGMSRSVARANIVDGFKKAADLLAPTKLRLVVEPLNHLDHPGFYMTHADELYEVIDRVNSPNVRMLFDLYHLQITQGNLINSFRQCVKLVGYIQSGDVPGRKEPGTGEVNYRNVLKAIYDAGYTDILGMEHGTSLPGRDGVLKMFEAYKQADAW